VSYTAGGVLVHSCTQKWWVRLLPELVVLFVCALMLLLSRASLPWHVVGICDAIEEGICRGWVPLAVLLSTSPK
jgi:hypothetical protein